MKLAELIIQMSANTASLEKDFNKATQMAESFASSVKGALSDIGIGLSVAGLGEMLKSTVEYEAATAHAAKATGTTIEQFSALQYAAKQTEVPVESLKNGLVFFDRVVSGLSANKNGNKALSELGISARDANGHLKPTHELLLEVADAFQKHADGANKSAIAAALFGRSLGADMIPMLDQGRAGISAMEARAAQLGVVLSGSTSEGAEQAYRGFQDLSTALRGLEIEATNKVIPTFVLLTQILLGNKHAVHEFSDEVKLLWIGLKAQGASLLNFQTALPGTNMPKGGILDGYLYGKGGLADQATDLYTDQHSSLAKMMDDLASFGKFADEHGAKVDLSGVSGGGKEQKKSWADQLGQPSANATFPVLDRVNMLAEAIDKLNKEAASSDLKKFIAMLQGGDGTLKIDYQPGASRDPLGSIKSAMDQAQNAIVPLDLSSSFTRAMQAPANLGKQNPLDKFQAQAKQLGTTLEDSFVKMIVNGQNFGHILSNLTTLFAEFLVKAVLFKELASAFSGSQTGIGGLIGSFFGGLAGGRASGGPVTSGSLYMVGESGPELFAPGMSGSIIPNGAGGSGGGGTVNIDARGADAGVEHRIMRAMDAARKQTLGQSLVQQYEYNARQS